MEATNLDVIAKTSDLASASALPGLASLDVDPQEGLHQIEDFTYKRLSHVFMTDVQKIDWKGEGERNN